jgi:hypothetical protein
MRQPHLTGTTTLPSFVASAVGRLLCYVALAAASVASHAAAEMGVYRWDAPNGPANVDAFSQWLGRPVTLAKAFGGRATWDDIAGPGWQLSAWSQWVRAQRGRNLILSVPMLPGDRSLAGPDGIRGTADDLSLAKCGAGQYDVHWARLANNLTYYGLHWAYLRLGWEMDGNWYAWSATPGSGNETHFASCFRRIVQVMRRTQPANQWKFVWSPANAWSSRTYLDATWPGNDFVDFVGMTLYDQSWAANTYPYPSSCDATCRLTRQQNAWNHLSWHLFTLRDFALARGKAMALPEWGAAIRPDGRGGGDNPYFVRKVHEFIQHPYNNVGFHSYWNVSAGDIDGRLTNSVRGDNPTGSTRLPQAANVFRQLFGATPTSTPTTPTTGTAPTGVTNVALASAGAVASASSSTAGYPVSAIHNNQRTGAGWGNGGGWLDGTWSTFPDWVQINFNGAKSIDRVVVYTLQDNYLNPVEPTDTMRFTLYGVVDFTVQGWNGSSWVTLGTVTGNNLVKRTVTFPAFTTDRIRVRVTNALRGWSRITEVQAWGVPASTGTARENVALASTGAVASASSAAAGYPASAINNNRRSGAGWGSGGGWLDATWGTFPDWVQINFNGARRIDRAVVYTLQDNYLNPVEPTDTMTFSLYGIVDFNVQGWNGSSWVTLSRVTGNNLVKRTVTFPAFTTDRIRVQVTNGSRGWSRITEVEAWGVRP